MQDKLRRQTQQGIAWVLVAILLLSIMDALLKWMAQSYPALEIVFIRNIVGLLPLSIFLLREKGWRVLATKRLPAHFGRSIISLLAMACFTTSLGKMKLADATAVLFSAPLFMTALSGPLLAERVGVHRWLAVLIGFAGVLIVLRPGKGLFELSAFLCVAAAVFYALTTIAIRALSKTESTAAIVCYNQIGIVVFTSFFMPELWKTPTLTDLALFIVLGLLGGFGQIALTQACRLAPLSLLAPFDYTGMLWAVFLGYFVWNELPDRFVIFGVVLVALSTLFLLHREGDKKYLCFNNTTYDR